MKKTNIKRIITVALAVAMIAALAACSVTGHFTSSSTETHTQETAASAELASATVKSTSAETKAVKENAHKTGVSFTLYYTAENPVTVYEYSDGTYRDDSGKYYHECNATQWVSSTGATYGVTPETAPVIAEPTDVLFKLYTASGDTIYIFEMKDGTYQDFEGNLYHKYNAGQWQREDGTILYLGTDECPFSDGTEVVDCTYGEDVVC